ncbi:DNA polymerase III subunit delta [Halorhodospira halophila]|uniref:DNA polymerase III subunit delta n=1 Tax=Halorhodospira halophila (strain DSM 244 / SL1) TaxID=349124 RepID=A1WYZ5_HALHL|nr:DNA polymerase III subunit delta [Halorhodospira halophila]ABM62907.1 DNA polymerase III, delta subunit [Halorhodospira halophila SL1]MBK1727970.1 DNA polymerase III subunit delta [Halorhodospira halophila]
MAERPETLHRQLERGPLPRVCFIAGEEPLLQREATDAVRRAAREAGHSEREVLDVDAGFDWGWLTEAASSLSLFGDRRLLEVRMPGGKPGRDGAEALKAYCQDPPEDTVLLLTSGRLERSARESAWARALAEAGIFVYCWPVPGRDMPRWVAERLRRAGLQADPEAAALIAERSEGNLLAADQAVEKLRLLVGSGTAVDVETAAGALADSARYTVDDLADAALDAEWTRALRVLATLREEGVQPPLILWALARDIRVAARLAAGADEGVLQRERIWKRRVGRLRQAARRHPAGAWRQLLQRCHRVDRAIKGLPPGDPWEQLRALVSRLARAMAK